jgi:hypothetical protein
MYVMNKIPSCFHAFCKECLLTAPDWVDQCRTVLLQPGLLPILGGTHIAKRHRVFVLVASLPRTARQRADPRTLLDTMDGAATSALWFGWQRKAIRVEVHIGPVVEIPLV